MAASILLLKEKKTNPEWQSIRVNTLFDFVISLHQNIKGTPAEKALSRLGGVRLTRSEIVQTGSSRKLKAYYPVMQWSDEGIFYQVVQDLTNYTYSRWLGAVAGSRYNEVQSKSQEVHGDMAALGPCYLASIFPRDFKIFCRSPTRIGDVWRPLCCQVRESFTRETSGQRREY